MSAIALFGKMLSFSRLKVMSDDVAVIKSELSELVGGKTPIPVVLDTDVSLDLKALVDMLWELGIQPIGVVEGALTAQANELRLATFPADGKRIERLKPAEPKVDKKAEPKPADEPKADKADELVVDLGEADALEILDTADATNATIEVVEAGADTAIDLINPINADKPKPSLHAPDVIDRTTQATPSSIEYGSFSQEVFDAEKGMTSSVHNYMLRSGQSVQHLGGDLVIIGGVNNGAEAITDNNLHIYGHGQGRLVAGATGDKDARIFCQKFNPSLVSVAGTYCLREAIPAEMIDKAVQVSYDADKGLIFTLMTH